MRTFSKVRTKNPQWLDAATQAKKKLPTDHDCYCKAGSTATATKEKRATSPSVLAVRR